MATWVQQSGGKIIAVNIQYRLGLLGFLASSAVMADGTANAGLLDQKAAIAWVTRYLALLLRRYSPRLMTCSDISLPLAATRIRLRSSGKAP
jgi:hypothetical protein